MPFMFIMPSETEGMLQLVSALNVRKPILWADEDRDITAWSGNKLQLAELEKICSLERKVKKCNDTNLKKVGSTAGKRLFLLPFAK